MKHLFFLLLCALDAGIFYAIYTLANQSSGVAIWLGFMSLPMTIFLYVFYYLNYISGEKPLNKTRF